MCDVLCTCMPGCAFVRACVHACVGPGFQPVNLSTTCLEPIFQTPLFSKVYLPEITAFHTKIRTDPFPISSHAPSDSFELSHIVIQVSKYSTSTYLHTTTSSCRTCVQRRLKDETSDNLLSEDGTQLRRPVRDFCIFRRARLRRSTFSWQCLRGSTRVPPSDHARRRPAPCAGSDSE